MHESKDSSGNVAQLSLHVFQLGESIRREYQCTPGAVGAYGLAADTFSVYTQPMPEAQKLLACKIPSVLLRSAPRAEVQQAVRIPGHRDL